MNMWADLECDLHPEPKFPVQDPDGRRDWTELQRQTTLFRVVRTAGPKIAGFPIPNAGKRNPLKARREGIVAGVFDTCWNADHPFMSAWIELKGYDAKGRAGKLSPQQIEWGNRMHLLGKPVACFFCPYAAAEWLRMLGFPIMKVAA